MLSGHDDEPASEILPETNVVEDDEDEDGPPGLIDPPDSENEEASVIAGNELEEENGPWPEVIRFDLRGIQIDHTMDVEVEDAGRESAVDAELVVAVEAEAQIHDLRDVNVDLLHRAVGARSPEFSSLGSVFDAPLDNCQYRITSSAYEYSIRWLSREHVGGDAAWEGHPMQIELQAHHEHVVETYRRWRDELRATADQAPSIFERPMAPDVPFWGGYWYSEASPSFAPHGARPTDTISWAICPLMADAIGHADLYPSDLIPRPSFTAPELHDVARYLGEAGIPWFGHVGITWARLVDLLALIFESMWSSGFEQRIISMMDAQAHWSAHFQEDCMRRLSELVPPQVTAAECDSLRGIDAIFAGFARELASARENVDRLVYAEVRPAPVRPDSPLSEVWLDTVAPLVPAADDLHPARVGQDSPGVLDAGQDVDEVGDDTIIGDDGMTYMCSATVTRSCSSFATTGRT